MANIDDERLSLIELERLEKWSKIAAAIAIPLILALGGWIIQSQSSSSKLSQDYVKIAVDVLRTENTSDDEPLREWAVDLLNEYSKVKFPDDVRSSLISGESILPSAADVDSPRGGRPDYNLSIPTETKTFSSVRQKLINLAVEEINANVHEDIFPERVGKYWDSLGINADGRNKNRPWSGAFMSWLVSQSGNPHKLKLSGANSVLWRDAVRKGLTFLPSENKPSAGDLVFYYRRRGNEGIQGIREGKVEHFEAHAGVVYSVAGDHFEAIEGNNQDAVRLSTRSLSDPMILGFVRF